MRYCSWSGTDRQGLYLVLLVYTCSILLIIFIVQLKAFGCLQALYLHITDQMKEVEGNTKQCVVSHYFYYIVVVGNIPVMVISW